MWSRPIAAAVLAVAAAAAGTVTATPAATPSVQSGADDLARAAAAPLLGVNLTLADAASSEAESVLDAIGALGVDAVRAPLRWDRLEPSPGAIDWAPIDRLVAACDERGIGLLLAVGGSPAWARRDPPPPAELYLCEDPAARDPSRAADAPPTDPADLARFVAAVAERHRGRVRAFEVWPEPNLLPNWRATGPDPIDYGRLLVRVATAVRAADPSALVVSGGLAPTTDVGVCYLSDVVFLERLADSGALDAVDAVGIEPFGLRDAPGAPADRDRLDFARAEVLRRALVGRADVPLWATAFGWNGLPPGWSGAASTWGDHGEPGSARQLAEGYALARARWPWMGAMFVWLYRPAATARDPSWGFALVDPTGRSTSRHAAVQALARGDLPPVPAPSGSSEPDGKLGVLAAAALVAVVAGTALRRRLGPTAAAALAVLRALDRRPLALAYGLLALATAVAHPALGLAALAALGALAAAAPTVALAAVAAAAPFDHAFTFHIATVPVWPVELLILIALAGRVLAAWAGAPWAWPAPGRVKVHPVDLAVVALVAWAALAVTWSDRAAPALREWRTVILEPAIFYGLLRTLPDRRRGARAAQAGLVAGGVIASIWALAGVGAYLTGRAGTAVAAEGVIRANGPYRSPNNLALFTGRLFAPIAACIAWCDRRRRPVTLAAGAIVGAAWLATFSRGGLVLGAPATAVFLAVAGSRRWRRVDRRKAAVAAAVTLIAAAAVLVPFTGTERARSLVRFAPGSTAHIRLRLWEASVEMGLDHPWLGVGPDNFLYHYRERYVRRDAVQDASLSHPHNALLDWWTRLGVPGVGIFLVLVAGNAMVAGRALVRSSPDRPLVVAAAGMQVYALAHGLVDNVFFVVDLALCWFVAQATLLAVAEGATAAGRPRGAEVGPPGFEPGTDRL